MWEAKGRLGMAEVFLSGEKYTNATLVEMSS
jgi:hypothetical protein